MAAHRARLAAIAALLFAAACAPTRVPLTANDVAALSQAPSSHGTLVYVGDVAAAAPAKDRFRYERRVLAHEGGSATATHLTWALGTAQPIVLQAATYGVGYTLSAYHEVHAQLGTVSDIRVLPGGLVEYVVRRGHDEARSGERTSAPIVVGPTLFGFVRTHLPRLRAGAQVPLRFAVADQGRGYDFTLEAHASPGRRTMVEMRAASFFVRLGVHTMTIEIDDETDNVLAYRGQIPPRTDALGTLEAEARYRYVERQFY